MHGSDISLPKPGLVFVGNDMAIRRSTDQGENPGRSPPRPLCDGDLSGVQRLRSRGNECGDRWRLLSLFNSFLR